MKRSFCYAGGKSLVDLMRCGMRDVGRGLAAFSYFKKIPLKNPRNASTKLSMNGKSPTISIAPPFVLRLSKDERRVFQENHNL